ncbi:penicillin-binding protein [Methylopila jiangsuensis]|uniref:Penicillin-binding protein 1A n=1 Tax=Methylopila jiangsuensis TaxID=586230 RepID=A0A9W6JHG6_9HYPH|nr:penicillin-binding protein 1A [Methylopila jiangsuensis]MDR6286360.1 penicillin-binding protein 1A [Methylopila jiangsuensis]GLK76124.1 penicillin-binding protein [Methylopila jiangsuensis]
MRLLVRFLGFLFAAGTIVALCGAAVAGYFAWSYGRELPDYEHLANYEPPIMTRLHASDGRLIAEYAKERRLFLPIQAMPKRLTTAFISAEDKTFYSHGGLDFFGIARAMLTNIQNQGRRPQGASTITQQVAKNFLLTNETSMERKIKEALLSLRIEQTYSKDRILELYLNEIYLGMGAYGVGAASLVYFDKSVNELTLAEAAYLAALPKAPNNYHPFRYPERAMERRNWVIDRIVENGYATAEEGAAAKKEPIDVNPRPTGTQLVASEYFNEEVRRVVYEKYGEKRLYEGGLSVRTTLDPKMQVLARKALGDGLVAFDQQRGWRGPEREIEVAGDWGLALADIPAYGDIQPWRLAVVLSATAAQATIGLQPGRDKAGAVLRERSTGVIPLEGVRWARWAAGPERGRAVKTVSQVLKAGDVVYVEPLKSGGSEYRLRQVPDISGGLVVMEPYTGRVLALAGGFSYDESQFNRATQALRQPGSSFKPFIYAAALDNGYTPSSVVLDAAIEINQGAGVGVWRPENYAKKFYGPQTLRFGIEKSRNVMTVRLAQDMGMPLISEYARRFGVIDDLPPYLSMSLGAGETTVLRMTAAYSMFANGGKKITPTVIDRIQDRTGKTIYRHDDRECIGCNGGEWRHQDEPKLVDHREQVIDPMTAYQITSMMEGVVLRGTATSVKAVGKPIAGKTGTTNDYKDAWFVGFSPDLTVGVYLGYDKPRSMGDGETGGTVAAPVFTEFMKAALADKPPVPFRVPPGIKLIRINPSTGMRASAGDPKMILEAFKPGTAPPDSYSIIGQAGGSRPEMVTPEADRAIRSGTGGLY